MNKKHILILVVFFVVGFSVFYYKEALINMTQPIVNMLKSGFTRVQAAWATIPNTIRGIIQIGIPSTFAMFFAWTKIRAMDKLQQTKLEATQQITQREGELTEAKTLINQQKDQITTLQGQAGEGVNSLTTKLGEAQTTITSQEEQIKRLTSRVNEAEHLANVVMHPTEADLKKRLEQSGYTITKTVQ